MAILYQQLLQQTAVARLTTHSLDQSLYQASVLINNEEHFVKEHPKKLLSTRNLTEMRLLFCDVPIAEAVLKRKVPTTR